MSLPEDISTLSREDLLALVAKLQRQVMELQERVEQLAADNQELGAEVDRLTRQSKRQAAPFSKGTRSNQPKSPGRKPGEGIFSFRQAPRPEDITEPPVDVRVTLESCPSCGGKLTQQRLDFAYITELPPLPRPRVTQYRVWVCRCTDAAAKFVENILIWLRTSTVPPPTGLGRGPWPPPMPCITRWAFRCVRYPWCWTC